MMSHNERFVIITPVRNEERYIEKTIKSVVCQTITPLIWVIVDDGSTDNTIHIINEYRGQHQWINVISRENRGFRKSGEGVMEAFYDGYNNLKSNNWHFIVKLDGDLSFESDYFERCFEHFKRNPSLGIGGGTIYHLINGELKQDKHPIFHVRGATKIYRKECWHSIDGLIKATGWDTLDEVKANMLGWQSYSFTDIMLIHHRFTGTEDGSWRNSVKNGTGSYISGYHPLFMLLKCLKRAFQKPYIIASAGLFYGFISGYIKKTPRVNDGQLINYLRKEQLKRIFLQNSIWK